MRSLKNAGKIGFFFLFIFLLSLACHPLKIPKSNSSFYPYHFENIEVQLIKIQYRVNPRGPVTRNSEREYIPDSLIYKARVVLKFYPDTLIWNKPVLMVIDTQDKSRNFWFNENRAPLGNTTKRIFTFTFKTGVKFPWARFTLGVPASEEMSYIPDYHNIFRSWQLNLPNELYQRVQY